MRKQKRTYILSKVTCLVESVRQVSTTHSSDPTRTRDRPTTAAATSDFKKLVPPKEPSPDQCLEAAARTSFRLDTPPTRPSRPNARSASSAPTKWTPASHGSRSTAPASSIVTVRGPFAPRACSHLFNYSVAESNATIKLECEEY